MYTGMDKLREQSQPFKQVDKEKRLEMDAVRKIHAKGMTQERRKSRLM